MVHFGPFWPEEVHFGPFRSGNRTLVIPESNWGSHCQARGFLLFYYGRVLDAETLIFVTGTSGK